MVENKDIIYGDAEDEINAIVTLLQQSPDSISRDLGPYLSSELTQQS